MLDRVTGEPLVPVEERPVPQDGAVAGEYLSPTQPFPANDAFIVRKPTLTEADMWGFTPWDRGKCRELFRAVRSAGLYTPPSLQGTLTYPNNMGVMNWGSVSIDAERGLLLVNTSHVATITTMMPRAEAQARMERGEFLLPQAGTPYAFSWMPLLSPWGAPCNRPPWGTLTAIDLKSRKRAWEVPLGTTRDLAPFPIWLKLGTPNIGGPVDDGLGTHVHRRNDRQLPARVRQCDGRRAVEGPATRGSAGDADDVSTARGRQAVRRDRGRWSPCARLDARRLSRRVLAVSRAWPCPQILSPASAPSSRSYRAHPRHRESQRARGPPRWAARTAPRIGP